ncbi:MAG: hypothetical protein AB7R89_15660 [Dehalococcoidia bacterium]
MSAADWRFTSTLLMVFGPIVVVAGYFAAFTLAGAELICLGLGMLVAGVLLRTRLPRVASLMGGAIVFVVLWINLVWYGP